MTRTGSAIAGLLAAVVGACSDGAGSIDGKPPAGMSVGGNLGAPSGGASSGAPATGGFTQSTGGAAGTGSPPLARGGMTSAGSASGGTPSGPSGASGGAPPSSGGQAPAGMAGASGGTAPPNAGGQAATNGGMGGVAGANAGVAGAGAGAGAGGKTGTPTRITFGTSLDPSSVVNDAKELAASLTDTASPQWRAKGDQQRTYRNPDTGKNEPYRLCVPSAWDGSAALPAVMFLHGAGSDQNSYLDQNDKQLVKLSEQHGYLLISPKGVDGAYGNFLRLTAPFGDEAAAAALVAQATPETVRNNELSEQDVINVLELVLAEYPIDRTAMFLAGHSMGSGGTWYIGGKYSTYWRGIAPMSGPFVQKTGYPWDDVKKLAILVTEGTQAPSLDPSHLLRDWLMSNGFDSEYKEVNADHGGMIPLVLPDVFDFFDRSR